MKPNFHLNATNEEANCFFIDGIVKTNHFYITGDRNRCFNANYVAITRACLAVSVNFGAYPH